MTVAWTCLLLVALPAGYPDELRLALSADLQKRYRKLAVGERLLVP